MKRIVQLDGLRGIAIAVVLGVHCGDLLLIGTGQIPWVFALYRIMMTGWLGVDIFFVLSGFLITRIILEDRPKPAFWSSFYLRRAARILPAFAVVVALNLWIFHHFFPQLRIAVSYLIALIFFLENWTILDGGVIRIFPHLWSLAIEEQFYFLWPQARRLNNIAIFKLASGLIVGCELLRLGLTLAHVNALVIYYVTPTRIDGLCVGAALAVGMTMPRVRSVLGRYWGGATLTAVLVLILTFLAQHRSLYYSNAWNQVLAIPAVVAGTAMLIFSSVESAQPKLLARLLANPALTYLGRRSYGIYLTHFPIAYAVFQNRSNGSLAQLHPGPAVNLLLVAGVIVSSLILAEVSWHLIEAPALRLRRRWERKTMPMAAELAEPR